MSQEGEHRTIERLDNGHSLSGREGAGTEERGMELLWMWRARWSLGCYAGERLSGELAASARYHPAFGSSGFVTVTDDRHSS